MEIVENQADLEVYMRDAVKVSNDHPVLIDQYLVGKECEVDVISDGQQVLLPGIMEHIERAGVHSGDSMAVYPPQSLSADVKAQIVSAAQKLAMALKCIGMMNIQFIIHQEQVYVLEVNPRASRTVPFLSKVTGIPMAQVATQVILGTTLTELGYQAGLYPEGKLVHVKAPVFSFSKLDNVDSLLGPEMKSTGEVMGSDTTMEKALYKAFEACKLHLPDFGTVLFTIADKDKAEAADLAKRFREIGYRVIATAGTADYFSAAKIKTSTVAKIKDNAEQGILQLLNSGHVQVVINTMDADRDVASDGFQIRQTAIEQGIPLFTSLDTANAILRVLESRAFTTLPL
jgi:carbamoyl-phosphate synthase large subunit